MGDTFTTFIIGLSSVFVAGFVAWIVNVALRNRAEIASLRLHIAEYYLKKDDLTDVKKDLRRLGDVIFEIAGKLGIPARKD